MGINPHSAPRMNEDRELTEEQQIEVAHHHVASFVDDTSAVLRGGTMSYPFGDSVNVDLHR